MDVPPGHAEDDSQAQDRGGWPIRVAARSCQWPARHLLDVPVIMSEYAPNTFTTGLYVGIIGDLSKYWIADAMTLGIQRPQRTVRGHQSGRLHRSP